MTYPSCPSAITDQVLSDWQDDRLPGPQAQQMREHVPTCLSCQQRIADFATARTALRNERIPYLQDRIWRGIQAQTRGSQSLRGKGGQVRVIGRISIATAALLVLLFVSLATLSHRAGVSVRPTAFTQPTATLTALPTVMSSDNSLTPAQAWGAANRHIMTINNQLYRVRDVLPNAAGVVGETYDANAVKSPPPIIILIRYPAMTVQTLFTTPTWNNADVATDGRYIAWAGGYNATGGPGSDEETIGYYDLQTGQTRTLISGATGIDVTTLTVTHGLLLIPTNSATHSLLMFNLATGAQQALLPPHLYIRISWPYVLTLAFGGADITSYVPAMLINLQTQQQADVTQLLQQNANNSPTVTLDGATIFVAQPNAAGDGMNYAEIDHADQPGARPRVLFTAPLPDNPSFQAADSRILLLTNLMAWDRVQQRLVTLPNQPLNDFLSPALLDNGTLAYWQSSTATSPLVLRDDATLPTSPIAA